MARKRSTSNAAALALAAARDEAKKGGNWATVHNAVFGIGGVAQTLFPSERERTTFSKTAEFAEIWKIIEDLQGEHDEYIERLGTASGNLTLRIPKSLHAALLAEAKAEGLSLNQLCLSKLALQLRAAI